MGLLRKPCLGLQQYSKCAAEQSVAWRGMAWHGGYAAERRLPGNSLSPMMMMHERNNVPALNS